MTNKPDYDERLEEKIDMILMVLHGDEKGSLGMVQKVDIMWKVFWVWPWCTLSAIGGATLTGVVMWFR